MLSVAGEFVAIGRVLVEQQQRLAGRRLQRAADSVKKYPVLRPGSPFFTGKSGFGVVGIGFGMARGGGKIG